MRDKPVLFKNKSECCGCGGCVIICPKSAIKMIEDEEMFCYPQIDFEKCIGCFQCVNVCPLKKN